MFGNELCDGKCVCQCDVNPCICECEHDSNCDNNDFTLFCKYSRHGYCVSCPEVNNKKSCGCGKDDCCTYYANTFCPMCVLLRNK